ncbi:MAG: glycosyltransferase [Candidatus Absconditabacterales bacterium]
MARNIGLYHAMGTYVFFTDADCVADPLWLYNMLKCFGQKKGYAGFGGSIRRYMPQSSIERYGKNLARGQKDLQYLEHISHLPYIVLANAGFLKKNLIAVGGFDEDLISGGDVDICWKLGVKGYRIGICNTAVIYHKNRDTIKSYFKAYFRYAVYQSLLCKKYAKNKITINPYPWKLLCKALGSVIRFKIKNLRRFYDIIEAIAIISGDIYGAILFKVLYL